MKNCRKERQKVKSLDHNLELARKTFAAVFRLELINRRGAQKVARMRYLAPPLPLLDCARGLFCLAEPTTFNLRDRQHKRLTSIA